MFKRTIRDFKFFLTKESKDSSISRSSAYIDLWKKVNEIGEKKVVDQKNGTMPDPDSTELSEVEWKELEKEFKQLLTPK